MQLLGNRLRVKKIVRAKVGNIHLPGTMQDDYNTGGPKEFLVLQVGPGKTVKGKVVPVLPSPGDRVIVHSYTGGPVELGNDEFLITEDLILAVLPKSDETPAPQG